MLMHPHSLFIRNNNFSILSNIVSPYFYHPTGERFRICHVENMTFEETARWVWTFCHHKGWNEAATYAQKFREQEITGPQLDDLDHNRLEKSMEITNHAHREGLLKAIGCLFPDGNVASKMQFLASTPASLSGIPCPVPLVPINSGSCASDNQNSMSISESSAFSASRSPVHRPEFESSLRYINGLPYVGCWRSDFDSATMPSQVGSYGIEMASHAGTDMRVVSDSECSKRSSRVRQMNVHGSGTSKNVECSKLRVYHSKTHDIRKTDMPDPLGQQIRRKHLKKLILSLEPGQIPANGDEDLANKIKSRFIKFDNEVTVKAMEEKGNTYTIIFRDVDSANEALKKFKDEGFNIRIKYAPRPSPSLHIKHKALWDLIIRKGKSFRGNFRKGVLKRGESVWVDQVKGRRARVINRGWVSLYSRDGTPLLVQDVSC